MVVILKFTFFLCLAITCIINLIDCLHCTGGSTWFYQESNLDVLRKLCWIKVRVDNVNQSPISNETIFSGSKKLAVWRINFAIHDIWACLKVALFSCSEWEDRVKYEASTTRLVVPLSSRDRSDYLAYLQVRARYLNSDDRRKRCPPSYKFPDPD